MNKKKEVISLILGIAGTFIALYGVVLFNQYILMSLPLAARLIGMIAIRAFLVLAPIIIMIVNKDSLTDYGFTKNKVGMQIIIGILIAIVMSLVLTLLPHLIGLGDNVDNGHRYKYLWQFAYEFVYCILGVGFTEEFIFRGFVYEKIRRISNKDIAAVICSSVIFGLFHIFGGNIIQIIMTSFIGAFFCLCRLKIKNCSMLSLIIAHGVYDALITVWAAVFLHN